MTQDQWAPCPQGTLQTLRAAAVRRRVASLTVGTVSAAVVLLGVGFILNAMIGEDAPPAPQPAYAATLTCSDVLGLLTEFHEERLEPAMHRKMEEHLASCEDCHRVYRESFSTAVSWRRPDARPHVNARPGTLGAFLAQR